MKRKEAVYKGLEFIPTYFEDTSLTSPEYFQITEFPNKLTAGKNLFKLRGHPTNLEPGGVLAVEVLDYNGDPIYSEVIDFIDDDKSRIIAIYIYEETSPGDCTITLLAEASNIQGAPPPTEFQRKPNVKWSRSVPVNPNISNISEIIFESIPEVTVAEQVGVQLDREYPGGIQEPTYNTGTIQYISLNNQPAIQVTDGTFIADMEGGTLTVANPINPTPTPNFTVSNVGFTSTIKKILNTGSALLDTEYTVFSSQSIFPHTYNAFQDSAFEIKYEATPTFVETQNSQSYAYIEVKGLEPATGDVSRIKIFTSNKGTPGVFDLVNDLELEETEILIGNTSSILPDKSIGVFSSQSLIDNWETHTYQGFSEIAGPTLTFATQSLANGATINSSTNITNRNTVHVFQPTSSISSVFIGKSAYKVTLDAIGTRSSVSSNTDPILSIYASGSAFDFDTTDFFNKEMAVFLGKRVGEIKINGDSERYDDAAFSFETDRDGEGTLLFVVESGEWQIADIHVTSDNDIGYTPNYTRIKTPIETTHKIGNQISFKLEYYNVDGVRSRQVSFVNNLDWEGGNRYIDGNFSLMTGSLFVADTLETGVAISGIPNAGFIRSLGYQGLDAGFGGWMIWSGSALPGQTSKGNAYSGVGLELFNDTENFFRYSTSDNEIDIRTKKFFLGDVSSTFVSGSNGNLEIKSDNFHLTPEGNITASAAVFIDNSGNTMFDTNGQFVDALNVGRVLFHDDTEISIDMSNLPSSATAMTGSNVAGPLFHTFILPGETNIQMSFTYKIARTDSIAAAKNIKINAYIAGAVTGSSVSTAASNDLLSYGLFTDITSLGSKTIVNSNAGGVSQDVSGAETFTFSNNKVNKFQGRYVLIFTTFFTPFPGGVTGTLNVKNLVARSGRLLGSSIAPSTNSQIASL